VGSSPSRVRRAESGSSPPHIPAALLRETGVFVLVPFLLPPPGPYTRRSLPMEKTIPPRSFRGKTWSKSSCPKRGCSAPFGSFPLGSHGCPARAPGGVGGFGFYLSRGVVSRSSRENSFFFYGQLPEVVASGFRPRWVRRHNSRRPPSPRVCYVLPHLAEEQNTASPPRWAAREQGLSAPFFPPFSSFPVRELKDAGKNINTRGPSIECFDK